MRRFWLILGILCAGQQAGAQSVSVARATLLLDNWQLEDAKVQAEVLLAEGADDSDRKVLAAEVEHQRGEHVAALALLRASDGGLRAQGILPVVQASAGYAVIFSTLESEHFRIRFINKDEIVAHYCVPVLEAAYQRIGGDLEFLPAERGEKIVVEIYPDARGLAGATGLTMKEIETTGTIAVCKFHRLMITSPLATSEGYDWADTVAHEFTHLIISKKSRNTVPIWLHEGIAKFYESRWNGAAGRALSLYSEKLLSQAVRSNKFITFQQMHPSMAKLPSQEQAALAFAEVFTMIEYLSKTFGIHSIAQVLTLCGTGIGVDAALQKVYQADLKGLERLWRRYLTARAFRDDNGAVPKVIHLATGAEDAKKERPLEAIQNKAVHDSARLGELLQLRHQNHAAVIEYEKALAKGGMRYGTLVSRLARAYIELARPQEAIKLLDEGLKARPDDTDAHLLAGRIRLQQQRWPLAQAHFEAARLQNPFNPEIHGALAALYKHADQPEKSLQEQHFFELAEQPRQPHTYEVPEPPTGEAYLSITSVPWGNVLLDGAPIKTPSYDHPVTAGSHHLAFTRADKSQASLDVNVPAQHHEVAVLR